MRIIFMGTPSFAVPSLDILLNAGHEVCAVITATDKYGGRGNKQLLQSAVKKYALQKNIPVLQPKNLKASSFVEELKSYKAEMQVVVAFRMLPEVVWNMPPKGTINLHGSLLPKYRGAAPLNWAIINGEKTTGVSSFKLKHEIDTGNIILQEEMDIRTDDTAGSLHDRMMYLGAQVVVKTVSLLEQEEVDYLVQDESKVCKAPKIFREECKINFNSTSNEVYNHIRGLSPYPVAWTQLESSEDIKIHKARPHVEMHDLGVGKWETDGKTYLRVTTLDGFIYLDEVQVSGKRKMIIKDFLNGYKFT